jgi:hypothetical protein
MDVVIRKVLEHEQREDGSWRLLVEAEFAGTVVHRCRVTVPPQKRDQWLRLMRLDREPCSVWAAPIAGSLPMPMGA